MDRLEVGRALRCPPFPARQGRRALPPRSGRGSKEKGAPEGAPVGVGEREPDQLARAELTLAIQVTSTLLTGVLPGRTLFFTGVPIESFHL